MASFLLQVWNKQGNFIYEKNLNVKLRAWFVYFNTLVFMTSPGDKDSDCIQVVYLEKQNTTVKLRLPEALMNIIN